MSFIYGSCVGSFMNLFIYRYKLHKADPMMYRKRGFKHAIAADRSKCPSCNYSIALYDNLPVVSWFLLLGKCRNCKKPISFLYPFREILAGLIVVTVFFFTGITLATMLAALFLSSYGVYLLNEFFIKIFKNPQRN